MDSNYFLTTVNKSVGDAMRFARDFQANPDKYKSPASTPGTTPTPAPAPADPTSNMLMMLMMMLLLRMLGQGGGAGTFPPIDFPGFPGFPPVGTTPTPPGTTPTPPGTTPNPPANPPVNNPAYDYLENILGSLGDPDVPQDADFTQQVEEAMKNGDFTEAQLGEALKYQLANASAQERPVIGKLLAGLFDNGTLNPVPFTMDNFLSILPPDRWTTLKESLTQAGMLTSDGKTNSRLASFLLQALNGNGDSPSKAFAKDLVQSLFKKYKDVDAANPGKEAFKDLLNLANITVKDGQLVFPGETAPVTPTPTPIPPANDVDPVAQWNPTGGLPDFVKTLYQNILDRDPENQDVVTNWANFAKDKGVAALVKGFFNSDEWKAKNKSPEDTIEKLYESILSRHSDADGKAFWVNKLKNGELSLDQIIEKFVESDEYKARAANGTSPNPAGTPPAPAPAPVHQWNPAGGIPDFIKTLYENILGREPENQGVVDGWSANTRDHGLASTLKGFFNSTEFKGKNLSPEDTVEKLYEAILSRHSDANGKAFWVDKLKSGQMSLDQIVDAFVGSDEYKGRVANGTSPSPLAAPPAPPPNPAAGIFPWTKNGGNGKIARSFYLNILDREPESDAARDAWAYNIDHKGIAFALKGFFNSAEYVNKHHSVEETVEKFYEAILGRSSDAGGKAFWVDKIKSGQMTQDQVIDAFLASAEYKAKA